jgi:hypothetical protein
MNIDDPKLTAFALNELDEPERSTIARIVAASPEAQRFVEETRAITQQLKSEYGRQPNKEESVPGNLIDIRDDPWFWSIGRPLAIAAVVAVCAVVAGLVFFSSHQPIAILPSLSSPQPETARDSVVVAVEPSRATTLGDSTQPHGSRYPQVIASADPMGNSFSSVRSKPRSTFSIYVGGGTYPNLRRSISQGILPPKEAVRVEELINSFTYDYAPPTAGTLFSITGEVVGCPWEVAHKLVRIGVQGSRVSAGGSNAIAKDVAVEAEFNPLHVAAYRLIGYDRPPAPMGGLTNANVDSGEVRVGHSITALYEVIPAESANGGSTSFKSPIELMTVKLRYREAEGDKKGMIERRITDAAATFANASADFKFVAAVARFGLLLSGDESDPAGTWAAVLDWAGQGKGADVNGERADFIDLVRKAQALGKG